MSWECCDTVTISETWENLHNWGAVIDVCKLFRRDGRARRSGEGAMYVRKSFGCLKLSDRENRVEYFWAKIRGKDNKADILVGICFRPPTSAGRQMKYPTRSLTITYPSSLR